MNIQIILLITLALLIALGFSFYLNLYKNTKSSGNYALFGLRSFSIFLILLLLINPKITHTERFQVKDKLVILSDASESIKILRKDSVLQNFQNKILSSEKLNDKFEFINYNFGRDLLTSDSTSYFSEELTNSKNCFQFIKNRLVFVQFEGIDYSSTVGSIIFLIEYSDSPGNSKAL